MGNFRQKVPAAREQHHGSNTNRHRPRPCRPPLVRIHPLVNVVIVFSVYLAFATYTQASVRLAIEQKLQQLLGWKITVRPAKGSGRQASTLLDGTDTTNSVKKLTTTSGTAVKYHRRRIPCGLVVVVGGVDPSAVDDEQEEEEVLPLATSAVAERTTATNDPSTKEDHHPPETETATGTETIPQALSVSTLHARALLRYPLLERYVVVAAPSDDETCGVGRRRMIPKGTFRLRMGSEESTIEESPPFWIIEHGDEPEPNFDLVLGTAFWKDHSAQFGSDEVYLFPTSSSSSSRPTTSRVMVPYISMRSRPSFGALFY